MCYAFSQPIYAVDSNLNVVEAKTDTVDELQRKADVLKARILERTATMPTVDNLKAWANAMAEQSAFFFSWSSLGCGEKIYFLCYISKISVIFAP